MTVKHEGSALLQSPEAADAAACERAALWKLFSQADELEGSALDDWLKQLQAEGHPQLAALRRLIDTRDRLASSDFLETPAALVEEPNAPSTEWTEGATVGAYQLVRPIGSGGMAEVWLADRVDGAFKRQVAIKLLFDRPSRAQRENFAERFRRERDILAALHHPNIAGLHDAGVTPSGQPWLALEYVRGESITAWCDARRLSVRARVRLFIQVLHAVEYAHANLVMHRDLKPGNILVTESGAPMLLDFGIAKLIEPGQGAAADSELTREGGRPLTLAYASPEQVLGQPLTTACDQYALGVVLYELMCGHSPYEMSVGTPTQWQEAIVSTEPRAPSRRDLTDAVAFARDASTKTLRRELTEDLDAITLKALQKRPQHRYASVEGLRIDLTRWLAGEPVTARVPSLRYKAKKFVSRHRLGVSLASLAVAALTAAVVSALLFAVQARRESVRVAASRDALLDLFRQADPDQTSGGNVTAKDMLAGGRKRIEQAFAGQPDLQASLLASVGELQGNIGDDAASEATLARVVQMQEARHATKDLAYALVAHAYEIYHLGDSDKAKVVVERAATIAKQFPNDAPLQERVVTVAGQIAWQRNELVRGEALMRDALDRATTLYGPNDARVLQLLSSLASLETQRNDFGQARRYVTDLITRSNAVPSLPITALYRIELQRARIDMADGAYEQARADMNVAIPKCEASLGALNDWCLGLGMRQAELLIREGRSDGSLALAPAFSKQAESGSAPRRQVESLVTLCRILAASNKLPPADPLRLRLKVIGRSGPEIAQSDGLKAKALLAEAEALIRERNGQLALEIVNEASRRIASKKEVTDDVALVGRVKVLEGIALRLIGDTTSSLISLREAKTHYETAFGLRHPLTQLVNINLARSMMDRGERRLAHELLVSALSTLERQFGSDAPVVEALKSQIRNLKKDPESLQEVDLFAFV